MILKIIIEILDSLIVSILIYGYLKEDDKPTRLGMVILSLLMLANMCLIF